MSLLSPAALLWLIPLAGVIVALYLLKMRRRDLRVPASFLWPARTDEVRANSLFQRLRFSWLLALQLLAVALVVFALARPQSRQEGLAGRVTVLVLDGSASMTATDVRPTRFEEARRQAIETMRSAGPGDRMALIFAGVTPRVVFPLTQDPGRRVEDVRRLRPSGSEGSLGEALRLAASIVQDIPSSRIVALSDGVTPPVATFSPGRASLLFRRIGVSGENLAISGFGTGDTPAGRQVFVGVRNYGAKTARAILTLRADGRAFDSLRLEVGPGETWGRNLAVPANGRLLEAFLETPDILAADNYAATLANPDGSIRVLLVSRGNLFLERGLSLDPRVTLDRADQVPASERAGAPGAGTYDVVVFDGVEAMPVKARATLSFASPSGDLPVRVLGELRRPSVAESEPGALLSNVRLDRVAIDRAQRVAPREGAEVLASAGDNPLIVARRGARPQIAVAFDPLQSDFPLDAGFPIFLANALDFLSGGTVGDTAILRVGAPVLAGTAREATLQRPDGTSTRFAINDGSLVLRDLDVHGRYRLEVPGAKPRVLVAQLRSEVESDLAPQEGLRLGSENVAAVRSPARFADLWRPIVLVLLLVLAAEWWLFSRRS